MLGAATVFLAPYRTACATIEHHGGWCNLNFQAAITHFQLEDLTWLHA